LGGGIPRPRAGTRACGTLPHPHPLPAGEGGKTLPAGKATKALPRSGEGWVGASHARDLAPRLHRRTPIPNPSPQGKGARGPAPMTRVEEMSVRLGILICPQHPHELLEQVEAVVRPRAG